MRTFAAIALAACNGVDAIDTDTDADTDTDTDADTDTDVDTDPPSLVFASDWSTATGATSDACRDGTAWDSADHLEPDRVAVIDATGLSFPAAMTNVLAIRYEASDSRWSGITKRDGWALPDAGGVLAKRLYFRMSIAGTSATTHHPVQSAAEAGPCAFAAEWVMNKGDTFDFQIATLRDGDCVTYAADCHRWATTLDRDVTYRVEERYERIDDTTWRLRARVFDDTDRLIRSESQFVCNQFGHDHTLADDVPVVTPDPTCLRSQMIVNQGVGAGRGADPPDENRIFYGGFAVSDTDWIGPYALGE